MTATDWLYIACVQLVFLGFCLAIGFPEGTAVAAVYILVSIGMAVRARV